jgi:hypothetical protein
MSQPINSEVAEELLTLVEESLEQAKKAYAELRLLKDEKVQLEKVASEAVKTPTFEKGSVQKTVRMLVQHSFLHPDQQEKFASQLVEKPDNALRLVQRLLEVSAPAYNEGRGVPKSASTENSSRSAEDDSLWSKVIKEGA